jgi:hypothetical protein
VEFGEDDKGKYFAKISWGLPKYKTVTSTEVVSSIFSDRWYGHQPLDVYYYKKYIDGCYPKVTYQIKWN